MEWLFDGLGTLVVGLLIGGAGGGALGYNIAVRKTRQSQIAGDNSQQTQVGGDQITKGKKRG